MVVHASEVLLLTLWIQGAFYLLGEENRRCKIMSKSQNRGDRVVPPKIFGVYPEKGFTCDWFSWRVEYIERLMHNF